MVGSLLFLSHLLACAWFYVGALSLRLGYETNWLTEYAPDLLLYAALLEAAPFLKKDERIGTWQAMYDRAAQALSGEDLKRIMDRSANRSEA